MADWTDALEPLAIDVVAAWRGIEVEEFTSVQRQVRTRAGVGSAPRIVEQLRATADALSTLVAGLPDDAFAEPGGEEDWNVSQAIGHAADARAGMTLTASLAATGRWPSDAQPVAPGVPGPADARREHLVQRIETSRRLVERAAQRIAGHELDPCPLEHPWVGPLSCGEWILFAGVHDLMHLEQLHDLAKRYRHR